MTEESKPNELESIEELIISSALEQEALINLLFKKGIITPMELVGEIKTAAGAVTPLPENRYILGLHK